MKEINYDILPERVRDSARLWIEDGIRPGNFMEAAFRDNFCETAARADWINQRKLYDIATFMYLEAPRACRGVHFDKWPGMKNLPVKVAE